MRKPLLIFSVLVVLILLFEQIPLTSPHEGEVVELQDGITLEWGYSGRVFLYVWWWNDGDELVEDHSVTGGSITFNSDHFEQTGLLDQEYFYCKAHVVYVGTPLNRPDYTRFIVHVGEIGATE